MSEVDRDLCRKAAAECVELARATTDSERKRILLARAQEWLKLAYAKQDELDRVLSDFNADQMNVTNEGRGSVQRQQVQQQQFKIKPDEDG